jgi:hypothetical protein
VLYETLLEMHYIILKSKTTFVSLKVVAHKIIALYNLVTLLNYISLDLKTADDISILGFCYYLTLCKRWEETHIMP